MSKIEQTIDKTRKQTIKEASNLTMQEDKLDSEEVRIENNNRNGDTININEIPTRELTEDQIHNLIRDAEIYGDEKVSIPWLRGKQLQKVQKLIKDIFIHDSIPIIKRIIAALDHLDRETTWKCTDGIISRTMLEIAISIANRLSLRPKPKSANTPQEDEIKIEYASVSFHKSKETDAASLLKRMYAIIHEGDPQSIDTINKTTEPKLRTIKILLSERPSRPFGYT